MIAIGLVRPKTPANAGSVLRAAGCYSADLVALEGPRGHGMVAKAATDTMKAFRRVPTVVVGDVFDAHPVGSIPIAVDLVDGAVSLFDFKHPHQAFYIFGPEDGTLGRKHRDRCAHRVFIPTIGCMNLAATVNVVLYDRAAKASSDAVASKGSKK
jgi:tRNA(Leu) C34 or U34 (ribose-2'-O)-methylase TrmL